MVLPICHTEFAVESLTRSLELSGCENTLVDLTKLSTWPELIYRAEARVRAPNTGWALGGTQWQLLAQFSSPTMSAVPPLRVK